LYSKSSVGGPPGRGESIFSFFVEPNSTYIGGAGGPLLCALRDGRTLASVGSKYSMWPVSRDGFDFDPPDMWWKECGHPGQPPYPPPAVPSAVAAASAAAGKVCASGPEGGLAALLPLLLRRAAASPQAVVVSCGRRSLLP